MTMNVYSGANYVELVIVDKHRMYQDLFYPSFLYAASTQPDVRDSSTVFGPAS